MEILVSIIIPVYNGEKYVEESVMSVINQPLKNVEIILINDGSMDESGKICEQLSAKYFNVKYYKRKNFGIGATRNFGISKAKGKYIAFLDQDDIWLENFLDNEVKKILIGDADILGFSYYRCNGDMTRGKYIQVKDMCVCGGGIVSVTSSWNHHSSFFYSRKLVIDNRIECPLTRHEDEIFRHKCLYVSKKILYVNKPIFMYRNNSESETHRKYEPQNLYGPILDSWNGLVLWHKNLNNDRQMVELCESMLCIYGIEGIEMLYRNGISEKKTREIIKEYFHEDILKKYKSLNLSSNDYKRVDMFYNSHIRFVIRNRFKGVFFLFARKIKKIIFVQKIYEKIKYPVLM